MRLQREGHSGGSLVNQSVLRTMRGGCLSGFLIITVLIITVGKNRYSYPVCVCHKNCRVFVWGGGEAKWTTA